MERTDNLETVKKFQKEGIKTRRALSIFTWLLIIVAFISSVATWIVAKPVSTASTVPSGFSVQGVVVNQRAEYLDFGYLKANHVDFVYIQSTTGTALADNTFKKDMQRVQQAKLDRGIMHTFSSDSTAEAQVSYFIQEVGNKTGNLPIAISVNADQLQTQNSKIELTKMVKLLANHYNQEILIYTTPQVKKQLTTTIRQAHFWLVKNDTQSLKKQDVLVQYDEDHVVGQGVRAIKLPTSVFNGSRQAYERLLQ